MWKIFLHFLFSNYLHKSRVIVEVVAFTSNIVRFIEVGVEVSS